MLLLLLYIYINTLLYCFIVVVVHRRSRLLSVAPVSKSFFNLRGVFFHTTHHAFSSKLLHRFSLFFDVAFGGTSGVVVFSRSRKREKEYIWGWWFSSSLKRKERDELRRRSHSRNPIEEPTHSEVILTSSLSLLIFFLKQQTGCPRRLGGDEIGQSLGLSPVCPDDSNTHRRFISRVSKVGRRHRQSRETTHVRGNRKRAIRVSTVGKWNHVFTVSHE